MSSTGIDVVKVLVNAEKLSRRRWLSKPKYFEAAELYLQASGYFHENGLIVKSVQTLSGAVNCLEKCEELMLAAKTCEKLVNILCINSYCDNEIIAKVDKTIALYMRLHYVDCALQFLFTTASNLFSAENVALAQNILDQAINIAKIEQRSVLLKRFERVQRDWNQKQQGVRAIKCSTNMKTVDKKVFTQLSDHQPSINDDDDKAEQNKKAAQAALKNKKTLKDDKGNTQNVVKALDSTILPLSAAVYSGVGGYAAFNPRLIGLTPSQFREKRKFEDDRQAEEESKVFLVDDV